MVGEGWLGLEFRVRVRVRVGLVRGLVRVRVSQRGLSCSSVVVGVIRVRVQG